MYDINGNLDFKKHEDTTSRREIGPNLFTLQLITLALRALTKLAVIAAIFYGAQTAWTYYTTPEKTHVR